MVHTVAFATGAITSTFLGQSTKSTCAAPKRSVAAAPRMQFDFLKNVPNPFGKKDAAPKAAPPKAVKTEAKAPAAEAPEKAAPKAAKTEAKAPAAKAPEKAAPKKGASLPVSGGVSTPAAAKGDAPASGTDEGGVSFAFKETGTRGLRLLAEDLLKNLPEASGVGRQDLGMVMKPQYGEPGYKKQAFETVNVSELGISTFSDDKNYSGKVGGMDAIKKAALEVKAGRSGKDIKKEVLKVKQDPAEVDAFGKAAAAAAPALKIESAAPAVAAPAATVAAPAEPSFPLPDYLLPLPEDTPRKGMTWKNYVGR